MDSVVGTNRQLSKKAICISLAIVYIWFGALKFFPGLSPAEELAGNTINIISGNHIPPLLGVRLLAVWEVLLGIGFIIGKWRKWILTLFLLHMLGTFTPLFVLSEVSFQSLPFTLTLVGQYIIKNLVYISIGWWMFTDGCMKK